MTTIRSNALDVGDVAFGDAVVEEVLKTFDAEDMATEAHPMTDRALLWF